MVLRIDDAGFAGASMVGLEIPLRRVSLEDYREATAFLDALPAGAAARLGTALGAGEPCEELAALLAEWPEPVRRTLRAMIEAFEPGEAWGPGDEAALRDLLSGGGHGGE